MPAAEVEILNTLREAGVTGVTQWTAVRRGADKITYRLQAGDGTYVVQFYERTASAAACSLAFTAWLAARRYPAPAPRRMRAGGFLHATSWPAAVFPFITGTHPPLVTIPIAREMGSALALLHRIGREYDQPLPEIDRVKLIRRAIAEANRHASLKAWSPVALELIGRDEHTWETARPHLPAGPIHHDFHTDNLLFEDDRLAAVVDFDEVQHAPFIIDVARTLYYLAEEASDFRLPPETAATFFHAYDAVRPLEASERELLDVSFQLTNLTHVAFAINEPRDRPASIETSSRHRIYLANREVHLTSLL